MKPRESSPEALDAFAELEASFAMRYPDITRRKMFGMDGLLTNGKVFMSLFGDAVITKIKQPLLDEALALEGASFFNPYGTKKTEWAEIPLAYSAEWERYAEAAREYVEELRKSTKDSK